MKIWGKKKKVKSIIVKLAELFCCEISTFLKRDWIFLSLFPILRNQKITEKIEKMYPRNWGVSIRHYVMKQFTDFLCAKSVCEIYVLLESKWRHYNVTMLFIPYYLVLIGIFDVLTIFGMWDPYFINGPKITLYNIDLL